MDTSIRLAQEPAADALLSCSPLATLIGILLDQQVPMEWAFAGPYTIASRLGADDLDAPQHRGPRPGGVRRPAVRQARRAPLPGLDGRARAVALRVPGRALRRRPRQPLARLRRREGSAAPPERPTGLRQAEVPDLPGPARQATRRAVRRLAGGGGGVRQGGRTARPPTSRAPRRWPRSARTSRAPSKPPARPRGSRAAGAAAGRGSRPPGAGAAARSRAVEPSGPGSACVSSRYAALCRLRTLRSWLRRVPPAR